MMKETRIDFGYHVKDIITGFKGICTGYASYVTGCDQYLVMPVMGKDESFPEGKWLDDSRLEIVKKACIKLESTLDDATGAMDQAPIK